MCEIAAPAATGLRRLRLTYRDHAVVCSRENESVVVGRAPGCALVVADLTVSRRHCTITLRDGRFVLQDHSTNGTYVTVEGGADILAQGEEVILGSRGRIGFGRSEERRVGKECRSRWSPTGRSRGATARSRCVMAGSC